MFGNKEKHLSSRVCDIGIPGVEDINHGAMLGRSARFRIIYGPGLPAKLGFDGRVFIRLPSKTTDRFCHHPQDTGKP